MTIALALNAIACARAVPKPQVGSSRPPVHVSGASPRNPSSPAQSVPERNVAGVRTIWKERRPFGWWPRILGVDRVSRHLFLQQSASHTNPEAQGFSSASVDTIDCDAGTLLDRWEATPENAARINRGSRILPWSGPLSGDLVRYAAMLRRAGQTADERSIGTTPDGQHLFYNAPANDGSGEEAIFVTDARGNGARRFDQGLQVSYGLALSHDGKWGAFQGYRTGVYHAYLRRIDATSPPVRISGIVYPKVLEFSRADGALYALNAGHDQRHHCVHRVHPDTPRKTTVVFCNPLLGDESTFSLSPDGKTALLSGSRAKGTQANALWLRLSDGALLQHVPMHAWSGVVTNQGVMIAPTREGLAVVDLATKRQRVIPIGAVGDVWRNAWLDDHTLVVSLIAPKAEGLVDFEWVAVDVSPPAPD